MIELRLLGDPVAHSLSPRFQNRALQALGISGNYSAWRVGEAGMQEAAQRIREGTLHGANITLPHKRLALSLADIPSASARETGVANTWTRSSDGHLRAANTDVWGFRAMLHQASVDRAPSALLLGCGGAGAAAAWAMAPSLRRLWLVNRSAAPALQLQESLLERFPSLAVRCVELSAFLHGEPLSWSDVAYVVDATSLRHLEPDVVRPVVERIPWTSLTGLQAWLDLSYGAAHSPLASAACARGVHVVDGASMLLHQGAVSFSLWTGCSAPLREMAEAISESLGRGSEELQLFPSLVAEAIRQEQAEGGREEA